MPLEIDERLRLSRLHASRRNLRPLAPAPNGSHVQITCKETARVDPFRSIYWSLIGRLVPIRYKVNAIGLALGD